MRAEGVSSIEFRNCTMKNVLYVPELSENLSYVKPLTENRGKFEFAAAKVFSSFNDCIVLEAEKDVSDIYVVKLWKTAVN